MMCFIVCSLNCDLFFVLNIKIDPCIWVYLYLPSVAHYGQVFHKSIRHFIFWWIVQDYATILEPSLGSLGCQVFKHSYTRPQFNVSERCSIIVFTYLCRRILHLWFSYINVMLLKYNDNFWNLCSSSIIYEFMISNKIIHIYDLL
jgi:hypothetical protein